MSLSFKQLGVSYVICYEGRRSKDHWDKLALLSMDHYVTSKIIGQVDSNGDGRIDFEEFKSMMIACKSKRPNRSTRSSRPTQMKYNSLMGNLSLRRQRMRLRENRYMPESTARNYRRLPRTELLAAFGSPTTMTPQIKHKALSFAFHTIINLCVK